MDFKKKKIIIIGGGASGFFAAANLDEDKYDVSILEQNSDGLQKVKISGGGRCNVTHACFDPRELTSFYPRGSKELLSVFTKFQPGDTMEWFESRNVPLKIEKDNRVFPVSDSSQSIINAMTKEVLGKKFEIKTQVNIKELEGAVKRVSLFSADGDYSIVKISVKTSEIVVNSSSNDVGKGRESGCFR